MKFEVYCDEALPDLFTSKNPRCEYLMIGGLWIPSDLRNDVKSKIKDLREKHGAWGEIKWTKVSPSKLVFYEELVDLFMSYGKEMRFRCIAVAHKEVNMALHQNDGELGFYKFYYQLLHHWIYDFNEYSVFCDAKTNRDKNRFIDLKKCLGHANLSSDITQVQALLSKQVVLIQLSDLLLGMASSRINKTLGEDTAKKALVKRLESRLDIHSLQPTPRTEEKFNIFKIHLHGGW
jgi:hypothetical protein